MNQEAHTHDYTQHGDRQAIQVQGEVWLKAVDRHPAPQQLRVHAVDRRRDVELPDDVGGHDRRQADGADADQRRQVFGETPA